MSGPLLKLQRVKDDRGLSGWEPRQPASGTYSVGIPLLRLDPSKACALAGDGDASGTTGPRRRLIRTKELRSIMGSRVPHGEAQVQTQPAEAAAAQTQTASPATQDAQVMAQAESASVACTAMPEHRDAAEQCSAAPDITTIVIVSQVTGLPSRHSLPGFCSSSCRISHLHGGDGAGGAGRGQSKKTRVVHGTTSPSWSGEPLALIYSSAGGAPPIEFEVMMWDPEQGESSLGICRIPMPSRIGGGLEEHMVELEEGAIAKICVRSEILVGRRPFLGGGEEEEEEEEEKEGDVQERFEAGEVDGVAFEVARRSIASCILQARCRSALHIARRGQRLGLCDAGVQSEDVQPSNTASPTSASSGPLNAGSSDVMGPSSSSSTSPEPPAYNAASVPPGRHDSEVMGIRTAGGFDANFAAQDPSDWGNMPGITLHEVWEGRRLHYVAPGWGKKGAPLRGATEVALPESEAIDATVLLSSQPAPVLVRSRQTRRMEGLRDLFTQMNARLEALHQKADELDGELETARETDAKIEAVITEKRQKQRIGMLDDLAGVEQLADEELGQLKGLDHLLSQVSDVARDLALREDNGLGGMRRGAQAGTSKGSSRGSRSRPWAEGAAPDQLRRAAALRRKEDIVRYGKKREAARRVWSTVRGCYVAVDDDAGPRADGAQFAF